MSPDTGTSRRARNDAPHNAREMAALVIRRVLAATFAMLARTSSATCRHGAAARKHAPHGDSPRRARHHQRHHGSATQRPTRLSRYHDSPTARSENPNSAHAQPAHMTREHVEHLKSIRSPRPSEHTPARPHAGPDRHFRLPPIASADLLANRDSLVIIDHPHHMSVMIHVAHAVEPVWHCGSCGAPLMIGVQPGQILAIVLRCPACRAYNDTRWR